MIRASKGDCDRLDAAVLVCIKQNPRCRAAQILRDSRVLSALGMMPSAKSDVRWLDNSLQRLRRARSIECVTGGYWSVAKKGSAARRGVRR